MVPEAQVVPCQRCGGYKVAESVSWVTRGRSKLTLVMAVLVVTMVIAFRLHRCHSKSHDLRQKTWTGGKMVYDRWLPLVFVGGTPRSGASLVRVLLDAHPQIRCGPETRVISRVLQMYHHWLTNEKEHNRLIEAGVTKEVLQSAIATLLLEVIVHHGDSAPRLCSKDPLTLQHAVYLSQLFPNSKFLLVIRDARATVHSIISRQIPLARYSLTSYQDSFDQWNNSTGVMVDQCLQLGPGRCRLLQYERLILNPRGVLGRVLHFLEIPWHEDVLHHETLINIPGGVRLSRFDRSTAEVRHAIHRASLGRWVGEIPADVTRVLAEVAPLMVRLGYDPSDPDPDYHTLGYGEYLNQSFIEDKT